MIFYRGGEIPNGESVPLRDFNEIITKQRDVSFLERLSLKQSVTPASKSSP
jgi:hypothetical protein